MKKLLSIGLSVSLVLGMAATALAFTPTQTTIYFNGYVWDDTNQDGMRDSGEPGIFEAEVQLLDGTTNPVTETDANGYYFFEGLAAGDYAMQIGVPTGFDHPSPSGTGLDSGFDDTGSYPSVTMGTSDFETVNAGFYAGAAPSTLTPIYIEGTIWEDANQDGIQDSSEGPVEGATLELLNTSTSPSTSVSTTTSSSDGTYYFESLAAGDYEVQLTLPTGYDSVSPQDQGSDDALDSDFEVTDMVADASSLGAGDFLENVDAGIYSSTGTPVTTSAATPIYIEGTFWDDTNKDGIQDSTEGVVEGVVLSLFDGSDMVVNDATGAPYTSTTNSDGTYIFQALASGDYHVQITTLPVGYDAVSPKDQGTDDALDSDFCPSDMYAEVLGLSTGDFIETVDGGIYFAAVGGMETPTPENCVEVTFTRETEIEVPSDWFSDAKEDHRAYSALISLASQGIIEGSGEEHLANLNKKVNRAEVSKVISIARQDTVSLGGLCEDKPDLNDVPAGEWFYKYVKNLETKSIVNGYGDGTFGPANNVKLSEMYKFLAVSFDLITKEEADAQSETDGVEWYVPYQNVVVETGIVPDWIPSDLGVEISRGTFFYLLSGMLDYTDAL